MIYDLVSAREPIWIEYRTDVIEDLFQFFLSGVLAYRRSDQKRRRVTRHENEPVYRHIPRALRTVPSWSFSRYPCFLASKMLKHSSMFSVVACNIVNHTSTPSPSIDLDMFETRTHHCVSVCGWVLL